MSPSAWQLHRGHPAEVRGFCGFPDFGVDSISLDLKKRFWSISICSFGSSWQVSVAQTEPALFAVPALQFLILVLYSSGFCGPSQTRHLTVSWHASVATFHAVLPLLSVLLLQTSRLIRNKYNLFLETFSFTPSINQYYGHAIEDCKFLLMFSSQTKDKTRWFYLKSRTVFT